VNVHLFIYDIDDVEIQTSSFATDFYLVFEWATALSQEVEPGDKRAAWWPHYELMNQKHGTTPYEALECSHPEGSPELAKWKFTVRHKGVFKLMGTAERLWLFPFDCQYLVVDMSFWPVVDDIALILDDEAQKGPGYRNTELFFTTNSSKSNTICMANGIKQFEWEVSPFLANMRTMVHKYDTNMFGTHPRLQWEVPIRRRPKPYFKILVVAVLCNLISGSAFWIPLQVGRKTVSFIFSSIQLSFTSIVPIVLCS
jgi:hypothetical protein